MEEKIKLLIEKFEVQAAQCHALGNEATKKGMDTIIIVAINSEAGGINWCVGELKKVLNENNSKMLARKLKNKLK